MRVSIGVLKVQYGAYQRGGCGRAAQRRERPRPRTRRRTAARRAPARQFDIGIISQLSTRDPLSFKRGQARSLPTAASQRGIRRWPGSRAASSDGSALASRSRRCQEKPHSLNRGFQKKVLTRATAGARRLGDAFTSSSHGLSAPSRARSNRTYTVAEMMESINAKTIQTFDGNQGLCLHH
jgi:hypothetical protein